MAGTRSSSPYPIFSARPVPRKIHSGVRGPSVLLIGLIRCGLELRCVVPSFRLGRRGRKHLGHGDGRERRRGCQGNRHGDERGHGNQAERRDRRQGFLFLSRSSGRPLRSGGRQRGLQALSAHRNRHRCEQRTDHRCRAPGGREVRVVTVVENQLHVETTSTQMGEVITGAQMTAVPLNGRSFTDLLALQPGVAPVTTITSDTVQDVGASALSPSGDLNPGTISINGQREFANSFIVNGSDVEEDVNMGAAIIPNLDSIAEFRILTNNFDAEYGEFSGGQINVVTKSGTNAFSRRRFRVPAQHRSRRAQFLFAHARRIRSKPVRRDVRRPDPQEQDFLLRRLSGDAIDARHGHRPDSRSLPAGPDAAICPIWRVRSSPPMPTATPFPHGERAVLGRPALPEAGLPGFRGRALLHARMHQRDMRVSGRRDSAERLVGAGDESLAIHPHAEQCERHILHVRLQRDLAGRQRRLSAGCRHALGTAVRLLFSRRLVAEQSLPRRSRRSERAGLQRAVHGPLAIARPGRHENLERDRRERISFQLYARRQRPRQAGRRSGRQPGVARLPGGPGNSGDRAAFAKHRRSGKRRFQQLHDRDQYQRAEPGQQHISVARQFFQSDRNPHHQIRRRISLRSGRMSMPSPSSTAASSSSEPRPAPTSRISCSGIPSQYNQSQLQPFFGRNKYVGLYAQDSWRVKRNLTLNYGLRWDRIEPWYEKYNQIATFVPGQQSVVFPGAPAGILYPGDPGVPRTLAPPGNLRLRSAHRLGLFARALRAMACSQRYWAVPARPASGPATGCFTPPSRRSRSA